MYVSLRPGPYVCAEFSFGGLPAYLLKEEWLTIRTSKDNNYISNVERYIRAFAPVVNKNMIYNGG